MMRKYGCSVCTARFNTRDKMVRHEGTHANDKKPVACPYCEKIYSRRDKLRKHIEKIHPGKPMPEPVPSSPKKPKEGSIKVKTEKPPKEPTEKINVTTVNVNGQVKFKCPECETMFSYHKGCVRHVKMFHRGDRTVFTCPLCPLSYKDNKGLYQHMHRKHRDHKFPGKRKFKDYVKVISEPTDSEASEPVSESVTPSVTPQKTYPCKSCPKVYGTPGSLYQHKKIKHSNNSNGVSPLAVPVQESKATPVKVTPTKGSPYKKEYRCPVCAKTYANYMSLYMHKKVKHPGIPPGSGGSGSIESLPNKDGNVQVLMLGGGGLTPTGRREKVHQCAKCTKRYADLKGLASHIEKFHSQTDTFPVVQTPPEKEKVPIECPYCTSTYSRRDKLYEHIRRIHPGQEVPMLERSPKAKTPIIEDPLVGQEDDNSNSSNLSSNPGFGSGVIRIMPASKTRGNQGTRGKYKQKEYNCPHCGKGYCDATRLKDHVAKFHENTDDPWRNVGPNTDIAVRNNLCKSGFEVYKVLGVYSTGMRFRAARFAPVDHDKWQLTEEINKNVMKQSILKILTTLRKEDGLFKIDSDELINLMQIVSADALNHHTPRSLRVDDARQHFMIESQAISPYFSTATNHSDSSVVFPKENGGVFKPSSMEASITNGHNVFIPMNEGYSFENTENEESEEMTVEPVFENGEVMVQPVFEEGYEVEMEMDAD